MNTLPNTYGNWRHDIPSPRRIPHKSLPEYVTKPLVIDGGDVQIEAKALYSVEHGDLLAVELNGELLSPANLRDAIRLLGLRDEAGKWDADLSDEEHASMVADYHRSEQEDWE
jgi:hypothetical protein